jgi:hypothetical protein
MDSSKRERSRKGPSLAPFLLISKFHQGGDVARLKWLVEFAARERDAILNLTTDQAIELDREIFAWMCSSGDARKDLIAVEYEEGNATAIYELQVSLRGALDLVTSLDSQPAFDGWPVLLDGVTKYVRRGYSTYSGTRSAMFRAIVADLIAGPAGKRLMRCPKCERIFFKVGKMQFCGKSCSQSQRAKNYRIRKILSEVKS